MKPVAWAMFKGKRFYDAICPEEHDREEGSYTVPLYTKPQYRELTQEDCQRLEELMGEYWDTAFTEGRKGLSMSATANNILSEFRAILKKAMTK